MFKENKEFWLYLLGIVVLFFVLFLGIQAYIQNSNIKIENITGIKVNVVEPTETPAQKEFTIDPNNDYYANVKTNKGDFKVDLFEKNAPLAVTNFISLSTKDFYDGTKFHRLVPGVLFQGGSRNTLDDDPSNDKYGNAGYLFNDEINWDSLDFSDDLRQELTGQGYTSAEKIASVDIGKYRFAMANSGPDQNSSQFFIIIGDDTDLRVQTLRGKHTVFGEVIENTELIDILAKGLISLTANDPFRPRDDIVIEDIEIFLKNPQ